LLESVQACVFDAYGTLFDVNSVTARYSAALGENANAVSSLWRQRQLEYTWTRSLMKRYADFWEITRDALEYALNTFGISADAELINSFMNSYLSLTSFPEVDAALRELKSLGLITAILSNGTAFMLEEALRVNDLAARIDVCLSVDDLKVYKPDPRVYQYACDRLEMAPQQVCYISSNAWDLAGASCFGFHTVRINRHNYNREYLFETIRHEERSLSAIPVILRAHRQMGSPGLRKSST
jgi:2-haloacid dehalogenase